MTVEEIVPYIQGLNAYYKSSRGYDLGYSFIVFQSGIAVEVRGYDHNNAANSGKKWQKDWGTSENFNDRSVSIMIAVSGQDAASPAAVVKVNQLLAEHSDWGPVYHGQVDYTSCAGTGIIAQFNAGVFKAGGTPPTPPPVAPDCVAAEQGDGGWSLMRKLGIDPTDHKAARDFYDKNYIVYPDVVVCKP
jgi:hypothetical protein